MDNEGINELIEKMCAEGENKAFEYSDQLTRIGGDYVIEQMTELLSSPNFEISYLAAKTLSGVKGNSAALKPLFEIIHAKGNEQKNGGFVEALSGFDLSDEFVNIFKLFLSTNFKVESMASVMLDYTEFNITPRTIRKAEKHWNHYEHNTPHDELYDLKKSEVDELLGDLKSLFPDNQQ